MMHDSLTYPSLGRFPFSILLVSMLMCVVGCGETDSVVSNVSSTSGHSSYSSGSTFSYGPTVEQSERQGPQRQDPCLSSPQASLSCQPQIFFEGASVSQGIGATFSMQQRLRAYIMQDSERYAAYRRSFGNQRIVIIFDIFFPTNFPHWGYSSNRIRIQEVHKVLADLEARYDQILFSPLPNEAMIFKDPSKTHEQWREEIDHPANYQPRNMMLSNSIESFIASQNFAGQSVRDQINMAWLERASLRPAKYTRTSMDTLLRHIIDDQGYRSGEYLLEVKDLYADFIHFNDYGQSALIQDVILPGLEALSRKLRKPVEFAREPVIPGQLDEEWKAEVRRLVFNSAGEFLDLKAGQYFFEVTDTDAFADSGTYTAGTQKERNPRMSGYRMSHHLLGRTADIRIFGNANFPVTIHQDGTMDIDLRKAILAGLIPMKVVHTGAGVDGEPLTVRSYSRDYWDRLGGLNTNYIFEIKHVEDNRFALSWTLLPKLTTQTYARVSKGLNERDIEEIDQHFEKYHRVELKAEVILR